MSIMTSGKCTSGVRSPVAMPSPGVQHASDSEVHVIDIDTDTDTPVIQIVKDITMNGNGEFFFNCNIFLLLTQKIYFLECCPNFFLLLFCNCFIDLVCLN